MSSLSFDRYVPRTYLVSEGDILSAEKATELEFLKASVSTYLCVYSPLTLIFKNSSSDNFKIITVPRARRVHQTLLTTPVSALVSLVVCAYHITMAPILFKQRSSSFADVLLVNGPGTCFVLCAAVYINKVCSSHHPPGTDD